MDHPTVFLLWARSPGDRGRCLGGGLLPLIRPPATFSQERRLSIIAALSLGRGCREAAGEGSCDQRTPPRVAICLSPSLLPEPLRRFWGKYGRYAKDPDHRG